MKRLFMLLCAVVAFAACEQAPIEEAQGVVMSDRNLEVSFEGGDDTRIQLQNGKTVWTKGDHVSVFYRSNVNEEWQFMGETGDRTGQIVPVDNSVNPPATHNHVVVAYPYSADYFYNTETHNVEASLPAVQNYLKDSYGTNGNIMISSSEFNKVSLKSVCGWLKLQLTGDGEVVKSITLRGKDGEQVAGLIYVDSATATATLDSASGEAGDGEVGGTLVRPGTILTEVTLDCGEGVALGKNATAFYIALPPQTFTQGFTVEIEDTEGYVMEQSTDKALTIERNHIQPMAAFEFINPNRPTQPTPANNEIWYTATEKADPYFDDFLSFGSNVDSNVWDSETKRGIITFDGDVTMIGVDAFYNCDKFTSITLPESVTSIGKNAFYDCDGLTEFTIPDSVTTIGVWAFYSCTSLTSVNIPDSVTTIGEHAFEDCGSLTNVTIGDSVTTIGYAAFYDCTSLTSVNIPDSVTTIGNGVFYCCTSLTSVNIPDSVTTIGESTFSNCYSLTSVTIPDSVTEIGEWAFSNCDSLTSVNIPDSVITIGVWAFHNCTSLTEFTGKFAEDNGRILVVDGVLTAFAPAGITEYNIPDSVTTIGYAAFYDCTSLTSVNIPDSVTAIGESAFYWCTSLKKVYCYATIPPSLGYNAFYDNASGRRIYVYEECVEVYKSVWSSYKDSIYSNSEVVEPEPIPSNNNKIYYTASDVVVPAVDDAFGAAIKSNNFDAATGKGVITFNGNVTKIGNYAFYDCDSLLEITIPESVCSFGSYVFEDCDNLKNVTMLPIVAPVLGNDVFDDDANIAVNVYKECVDAYKATWSDYASLIVGSGNVSGTTTIKYTTTDSQILTIDSLPVMSNTYKSGVGEMVVYGVLTRVNEWLFSLNDQLKSITLPESITSIEYAAFTYSAALEEVTLGSGVTYIGNSAFEGCENLVSLYCKATTPPALGNSVFDWTPDNLVIYVPTASVNAYKSDADWSGCGEIVGYNF